MLKELFEHIQHTAQPIIHKEGETTFPTRTRCRSTAWMPW